MTKCKTFPEECNKRYLFSINEGSLKERNSFYTRHNSKHNLILIKARNFISHFIIIHFVIIDEKNRKTKYCYQKG